MPQFCKCYDTRNDTELYIRGKITVVRVLLTGNYLLTFVEQDWVLKFKGHGDSVVREEELVGFYVQ